MKEIGTNWNKLEEIESNWEGLRQNRKIGANLGKGDKLSKFGPIKINWAKLGQIGANWD